MSDQRHSEEWGTPSPKTLVDDLADVLSRVVVGWESIIGVDLAQYPDVVRVMKRYREEAPGLSDFGPVYQQGHLSLHDYDDDPANLLDCQVGLQTSSDGRIWLCVNGGALVRFKPKR